jgi:hypothetical protein
VWSWRRELIEVRRKSDNFMLGTYTNDAFGRRAFRRCRGTLPSAPLLGASACDHRIRLISLPRSGIRNIRSGQIAAEYDWDGMAERFFARIHFGNGIDEPLAMMILDVNDVNGNFITNEYLPYAFHRDTLGTITHLTNASGAIVERYECTPFGKTTIFTGTGADGIWNTPDDAASQWSRIRSQPIFRAFQLDEETGLFSGGSGLSYAPSEGRSIQSEPPFVDVLGNQYEGPPHTGAPEGWNPDAPWEDDPYIPSLLVFREEWKSPEEEYWERIRRLHQEYWKKLYGPGGHPPPAADPKPTFDLPRAHYDWAGSLWMLMVKAGCVDRWRAQQRDLLMKRALSREGRGPNLLGSEAEDQLEAYLSRYNDPGRLWRNAAAGVFDTLYQGMALGLRGEESADLVRIGLFGWEADFDSFEYQSTRAFSIAAGGVICTRPCRPPTSAEVAGTFFGNRQSSRIGRAVEATVDWLGGRDNVRMIVKKNGDMVIMRGNKKLRFDAFNPHGQKEHVHLEELDENGKWVDAGPAHRYELK